MERATFSLGCFWDPDARFGALDGVLVTRVGYCGGTNPATPSYRTIGDYTESVQIDFDPTHISFVQLLTYFNQWYNPNTSKTRSQYSAAIFYHNENQRQQVDEMKIENVRVDMFQLRKSDNLIVAATHGRGLFTSSSFGGISLYLFDSYFPVL